MKHLYCLQREFLKTTISIKAGVLLSGLCDESEIQETLFEKNYNQNFDLMSAIDAINYRYGRDTLQMASECKVGNWKQKEKTVQETIQRRLIDYC